MCRKILAFLVAIVAVFSGIIWYNAYLPISPELKGDEKLIPFFFGVNRLLGKLIGDKLGLCAKYKVYRSFFSTMSETDWLFTPDAKGITIEDSVISGVPVRVFRPVDKDGKDGHRPGLIYLHGGGLVLGSVNWTSYVQQSIMFAQGNMVLCILLLYYYIPYISSIYIVCTAG